MKPKIYLSSPHMSGFEQQYVNEAFRTNWIAPLGPNVDNFETDLQKYTGAPHVAALSAGTAAIHLALILLKVKPGDMVICQSFTFSATANPIAYLGAKPVFVDSEADTWNMSPECLEQAIQACVSGSVTGVSTKPKAILAVHLYGMPAKMEQILAIANKYEIPVIEDAAEALGSSIDGKKCGTFGKFGILSFNGNKIITTSGGGALLSDDREAIAMARFLATQARDHAPHYQHSHIGYNYRMSNIVAGIGRGQLTVIDQRVAARRANYERYRQYFASLESKGYHVEIQGEQLTAYSSQLTAIETPSANRPAPSDNMEQTTENREPGTWNREHYFSNRWLTTIIITPSKNKGITREHLRHAFEAENIESRPLWKPMHLQPIFKSTTYFGDGLSERLFGNGLCLPSGSNLTEDEWGRIMGVLDGVFK